MTLLLGNIPPGPVTFIILLYLPSAFISLHLYYFWIYFHILRDSSHRKIYDFLMGEPFPLYFVYFQIYLLTMTSICFFKYVEMIEWYEETEEYFFWH